ncbi:MAG: NFACT RNA binding domain-containing protein [Candidatus Theseobacter exili]|nr:NFACT RNA binding domain-containing protein [Candidatus Theseobacter exili]
MKQRVFLPDYRWKPGGETINMARADVKEYRINDKWIVFAGRTGKDNDLLSLKDADQDDWWFHVRGMSGSHVILKCIEGDEPARKVLESAAAIAAYHSKARNGGIVAVSCTRVRFVSKPRRSKTGTVQIRKETVLKVRPVLPEACVKDKFNAGL